MPGTLSAVGRTGSPPARPSASTRGPRCGGVRPWRRSARRPALPAPQRAEPSPSRATACLHPEAPSLTVCSGGAQTPASRCSEAKGSSPEEGSPASIRTTARRARASLWRAPRRDAQPAHTASGTCLSVVASRLVQASSAVSPSIGGAPRRSRCPGSRAARLVRSSRRAPPLPSSTPRQRRRGPRSEAGELAGVVEVVDDLVGAGERGGASSSPQAASARRSAVPAELLAWAERLGECGQYEHRLRLAALDTRRPAASPSRPRDPAAVRRPTTTSKCVS